MQEKKNSMSTVMSEMDAKRNALSAFVDFHRRSADTITHVVKVPLDQAAPDLKLEMDSFTEDDVECRQMPDGSVCVINHLHMSKTQKGMPHIFEYEIKDDPAKARYQCKPTGQTNRPLFR